MQKRHLIILVIISLLIGITYLVIQTQQPRLLATATNQKTTMSYHTNILTTTKENKNFRRVLFTGKNSQLVVMSIPPGGEVGAETHKYTEQTLFFLSGNGEGTLATEKFPVGPGDVVVVVPGTYHNFKNTGTQDLKIYTTYAPPNHLDGLVEATKAEADANLADEAIGETPPQK